MNEWSESVAERVNIHYRDIHGKSISESRSSHFWKSRTPLQIQGTRREPMLLTRQGCWGITRDKVKELMRRGFVTTLKGPFSFCSLRNRSHCRFVVKECYDVTYLMDLFCPLEWTGATKSIQVPRMIKMISHNPGRE